jgi:hypothetical protein
MPSVMNERKMQQRVRQFKNGQTNVRDEDRSGCPSIMNDDLVDKGNNKIGENCRFITSELSTCFPQISRTLLCGIVAERLHYHTLCASWVPKMQMDERKKQCRTSA